MVGELHLYKVAKCVCMCLCPVLKMAPEALRHLIATSTTSSLIYLTFSFSCSLSSSHTCLVRQTNRACFGLRTFALAFLNL